jgi:multiple sugar transport system substrate-binding protein
MDAYDVKLVDNDGKLLTIQVKKGLISALTDYTDPYAKGCSPPSPQVEGSGQQRRLPQQDDGNDHNATISIAAKWAR